MANNSTRLLLSKAMPEAGLKLVQTRSDVEAVPFDHTLTGPAFQELLKSLGEVHGMILGLTRISEPELALAKGLQVVARTGVGYDAIDVPALTKRRIPLMVTGTANSPSVAEQAMFMMLGLAKRGAALDAMVRSDRWGDRLSEMPVDLFGKTVLIVGFGRIGSRTAKRTLAMEMTTLVYDPYVPAASIKAAGAEPVKDLEGALPRADFVSIHCPKTPETVAMFNARRLALMKPTAYLVNTARGGIIDEPALHQALTAGKLAGAGLDVFELEPPKPDNPLLKLSNVITAPHVAGVTREAFDRMAVQAVENVFSVFDGRPIRDNIVNREILG